MAYLRDESDKIEIDYPLNKIWSAIPTVIKVLEWTIQEQDDQNHKMKLKTKSGFLSYSTVIAIEITTVDEKTSRLTMKAETPVTTITSMADFGRTRDRVDQFIEVLAKLLNPPVEKEKKKKKPSKAKATGESASS